jgi:hypothetical protein
MNLREEDGTHMNERIIKTEILSSFSVLTNNENKRVLEDDMHHILSKQDPSKIENFLEGLEACRKAALQALQAMRVQLVAQDSRRADNCITDGCSSMDAVGNTKDSEATADDWSNSGASSSPSFMIPVEAIHQVCQSDFLTLQEIGRLLFLVSKSVCRSFGRERAWELVCCKQWRNTVQIPRLLTERRGYEWLFRQRYNRLQELELAEEREAKPDKIMNAELSPDKLMLLISIYNSKKKEVVSLTLRDGALKRFLDTGELNVALPEPVALGSFAVSDDGVIDFDMFCTEFIHWNTTLHLLRLDKLQCSCVHESSECSWGEYDYCEDPTFQTEEPAIVKPLAIDWSSLPAVSTSNIGGQAKLTPVEVDMGYLEFSSASGLEFSVVGKAFVDRIRACEHFSDDDTLQSIRIEPTLLCFTKDFQPSLKSVGLCFSELRLDVWKRYRSGAAGVFSAQEAKRHDITLLHLLDQLNDWED